MMRPVQNIAFLGAIEGFEAVYGHLSKVHGGELHSLKLLEKLTAQHSSVRQMVRVTVDGDVVMESFQMVLGMCRADYK